MTRVDYSENESTILGLKIGRCNEDGKFDELELYRQILAGSYDVCRLKIPSEDEMASVRLHKIGLPFFFSGSIRRYKTPTKKMSDEGLLHPDMIFEPYDGTQNELLRDMLVDTWGSYPIGYYRSPYIKNLVSNELEIESVYRFYKKQNDPRENPANGFMFLKHNDRYVGFFAINKVGNNLESHVGGILSPYRKEGYFLDKLAYIKQYCRDHKLEHFVFGARNENAEVQRIFQYVGFHATGTENVFHIPSLLRYTQREPITKRLTGNITHINELYSKLFGECIQITTQLFPDYKGTSFNMNFPDFQEMEYMNVIFSFPVINADEILIVLKSDTPGAGLFSGYFRLVK